MQMTIKCALPQKSDSSGVIRRNDSEDIIPMYHPQMYMPIIGLKIKRSLLTVISPKT